MLAVQCKKWYNKSVQENKPHGFFLWTAIRWKKQSPTDFAHLKRNSWDLYSFANYSIQGICLQEPFPAFCRRKAFFVPLYTSVYKVKTPHAPWQPKQSSNTFPLLPQLWLHMTASHSAVPHDAIKTEHRCRIASGKAMIHNGDNDTPVQPQRKQWGLLEHTTLEKLSILTQECLRVWISTLLIVWRLRSLKIIRENIAQTNVFSWLMRTV